MSQTATLPDLPYAYNALEPYISEQIMRLHHSKHHQTYVNSLNAAEAAYAKASTPKERIALQAALKFNGGGRSSCYRFTISCYLTFVLDYLLRTHQPFFVLEELGSTCFPEQG